MGEPRFEGGRRPAAGIVMPNHDPLAIANEFLKLSGEPLPQMKLQKLVYIAHGWNLAINDEPLVSGRIEAWDGGPVMRSIWNHIRDFGYNVDGKLLGAAGTPPSEFRANLTESEKDVLKHVWRRYAVYTGAKLSQMTHEPGTPWSNAYFGSGRNAPLSETDIQQHFRELALAGRNQTA